MSSNGFSSRRLGEIIRKHRELRNLTQEKVSSLSRVDRTYIARIESGKANPTLNILYRISKIFNLSLSEFFKEF
jgi:transcriptional regulator with XRE-family HTH domain